MIAEASAKNHSSATPAMKEVGGVETIKPQEALSKDAADGNGWTGAYVGVNAGGGFGTAMGTNFVVPFETDGKSKK